MGRTSNDPLSSATATTSSTKSHVVAFTISSVGSASTFRPREEQDQDQRAADKHNESCTDELIRRTRDTKKFPLVFKGLTEYGFRRNLFGLKAIGVFLAVAGVAGSVWSTYSVWTATDKPFAVSMVADSSPLDCFLRGLLGSQSAL